MNRVALSILLALVCVPQVRAQKQEASLKRVDTPIEGTAPPPPIKIALSGKALEKYSQARSSAVEYLKSPKCSKFLRAHNCDPERISQSLSAQQPLDGRASSISFAAAGITSDKTDSHAQDSIQSVFTNPAFLTMAVSQPLGVDTYYNPDLLMRKIDYPYSNPISVIHEALHNLTGESDVAIAQDFGYHGFESLEANVFLNEMLKKYCDSRH